MSCATCCPVNLAASDWEHERYLGRVQPAAVLSRAGAATGLRAVAGRLGIPVLDAAPPGAGGPALVGGSCGTKSRDRSTEPPVLVLPTSGTTGEGRLVGLTARNVMAAAHASGRAYGLCERDTRLNAMPMFHVQGIVGSLLASVVSGGSVRCLSSFDPAAVAERLLAGDATWYSGSPTMYERLLAVPGLAGNLPPAVRFLRVGSAALGADLRGRLEGAFERPVTESYGMTEAHQIASSPIDGRIVLGLVPTGSSVRVLAAGGRPGFEPGDAGELLIAGPNVTPGDFEMDPLPPEAFVDGWLRTGDVGQVLEDGSFRVVGRTKEMINRGGEKISPLEVEAALRLHPAVAEAAVFAVPDPLLGEEVAAAVVLREGSPPPSDEDIRAQAAERLSPHKVPRAIARLAELPRTPTGKVRRGTLAERLAPELASQLQAAGAPAAEGAPPGPGGSLGAVEAAVAGLWTAVLGRSVGSDVDFFRTGADSLALMSLVAHVETVFGVVLDPIVLYDRASTVHAMAALVEELRGEPRSS
jgi:hypothetical protein